MSATTVRRGLYGMFAGGLLAFGSAAIVLPVANAVPDACSQSGIATTASSVSASTAAYLAAHPQTNQELTEIAKQPTDQVETAYQAYFEANPQVANELQAINQPASDLLGQCGVTVTPTPISEILQTL
ncbi:hemophore-related protein [Mycobacterium sp. 3519A]|uniref:hemophore-related protein n=1 Tax=Mycobacterium sp. 3519A TaxID=2057184 RepID=UPI001F3ED839|nr:hemophore-related protein [Mycobacterium sp. 3519A]